jgi:hypothetical protein
MLHQHGSLLGSSPWTAGNGRRYGAATARAGSGVAMSPDDPWRPWRAVPVPTCGPAGDAAGQAPPVGLAVKLGQVRHGQRDTQLVVVHLGPSG